MELTETESFEEDKKEWELKIKMHQKGNKNKATCTKDKDCKNGQYSKVKYNRVYAHCTQNELWLI